MLKYVLLSFSIVCFAFQSMGQKTNNGKKVYMQTVSDLLIQMNESYDTLENASKSGVRTTYFFNYGDYMHVDFSNSIGLVTGIAIRNVGMKTFDQSVYGVEYDKIKRRVFALGGSAALKLGSFSKHSFVYAGGEYELAFHYRQKLYSKSGNKVVKQGEWLSSATNRFLPSAFVGYQLPSGMNFQLKYYFDDFLNNSYKGSLGDFTVFKKTQLICLAVSYQVNKSIGDKSILDKLDDKRGIFDL